MLHILLWIIFLFFASVGAVVTFSCIITFILVKKGRMSWDWKFTNKAQ